MIAIIDFGSQTAHLIGRRLRDLGVKTSYIDPENAISEIKALNPRGIILSGGPDSVYEANSPKLDPQVLDLGIPILGICYGEQLIAQLLGGVVEPGKVKEYGPMKLGIKQNSVLFQGIKEKKFQVWMSHGDKVSKLPTGFKTTASTTNVKFAAVENEAKQIYAVQFHPEVKPTQHGTQILGNFVLKVCQEVAQPLVIDFEQITASLKTQVGQSKVICAVSGGVDSSVAAFLIGKAIGKRLIPVYVDSGLMRNETEERVKYIFEELIGVKPLIINAKSRFLKALKGITDPEEKRKTIGKLYVDIFQEEAKRVPDVEFLGQGTIYSDVIESKGSKHASHIKSHHNVGGLPKDLKLKLLEPLRGFYKDEVRKLGIQAGLPKQVVMEQPFPGPGYAVRIRGEVTESRLEQVKAADQIVVAELKKSQIYDSLFQCFALLTGAMSTAVKGDARIFAEVVAVRAYVSDDVMTSEWAKIPYEVLQTISSRIVNEVSNVSRVVYDITTKPPATMEWE